MPVTDPTRAAQELERLIIQRATWIAMPQTDPERGLNHLRWMLRQIYNEQVTGYKAREWLGYVGGALVAGGAMSLDELKALRARVYRQE